MGDQRISRRQVLAAGVAAPVAAALGRTAPSGATGAATPTNPADLTLVELLSLLERRQLSARELVDACIARAEALDPTIKAFRLPTFDLARAGAAGADEARAAGRPVGPLAGIPVGLKDTYYTRGIPTTASSRVLADFVPGYDATAWARLSQAGAVLLGYGATTVYPGRPTTAYEVTVLVEATSYHRRLARDRAHLYSPEVLGAIEAGETVSGADYLDAQRLRATWSREWREAFAAHRLDAVASPVIPEPAPVQTPSQSLFLGASFNLTKGWNLNGFPALSVPVGLDGRGLPVGLQLAALPLEEPALLALAIALDEDVRFFSRKPPLVEAAG